jgi:GWxTD domain-containing protein
MPLHHPIIRTVVLWFPFYCAEPILKQDEPPINVQHTAAVQTNGTLKSRHHRCFEQPYGARDAIHRLPASARYWLDEDAIYIISPEERCAFLHLETGEEREQFIEQFWNRRSSDPVSVGYDFKVEHYRRIVAANEKYGGALPGWAKDRGKVYVMFGPPDSLDVYGDRGSVGTTTRHRAETNLPPKEKWHYKYIQGLGEDVQFDFEYVARYKDYVLSVDEIELLARADPNPERFPITPENMELYGVASPIPKVRFKDLEAIVVSQVIRDQVKFSHRMEFAAATQATTLARSDIVIPCETHTRDAQNVSSPAYQLFIRISKPSGWVVQSSELTVGGDAADKFDSRLSLSAHLDVPLAPGMYLLAIVAKNTATGEVGVVRTQFNVPTYQALEPRN